MRALLASLVAFAGAAGCAAERAGHKPDWRLTYRLQGGAARFDVTFTVDSTGGARYARTRPEPMVVEGRLTREEVVAFARLVHESGFCTLAGREAPSASGDAAGHRYEFTWQEGGETCRIAARDGTVLPRELMVVREAVGALERRVLRAGETGAPGGGR